MRQRTVLAFLLAAWWIGAAATPGWCAPRKPPAKARPVAVKSKKKKPTGSKPKTRKKAAIARGKSGSRRQGSLTARYSRGSASRRLRRARPAVHILEVPPEVAARDFPAMVPPVPGLQARELYDSFRAARSGGRAHRAIDIMRPEGSPLVACVDGVIEKLHTSAAGGTAIYLADGAGRYRFYYAHLSAYADGLQEGMRVARGTVIGYVGSTGNASASGPHLHFQIMDAANQAAVVNPHPVLIDLVNNGMQAEVIPIMPTLPAALASFEGDRLGDTVVAH